MILLGKSDIDINNINFKKELKYSNHFSFVGLSYLKKDICIQTPKLYCQYGINDKYDKNFIDLSFKNIENDKSVENLKNNLEKIYNLIQNKYKKYNVVNYIKNLNIRLKVKENMQIYDQKKNKIDKLLPNTYGNYIIYLQGFWIIEKDIYFQWYVLQAKIDLPLFLEEYSFIDEIPKPPPLPKTFSKPPKPPPLPNFKKNDTKIIISKKKQIIQKEKELDVPSLEEIKSALSRLKTINEK
tara:strand:- start:1596 stop:2315 length:720 start_codon:yes stop_codon:yes gene_type:complete